MTMLFGCGFLAHGGLRPVDELFVEDLRAHGGGVLRVGDGHALLSTIFACVRASFSVTVTMASVPFVVSFIS